MILFKFIEAGDSVFPEYSSVNVYISLISITASLLWSQYTYNGDIRHAEYLDNICEYFEGRILPSL